MRALSISVIVCSWGYEQFFALLVVFEENIVKFINKTPFVFFLALSLYGEKAGCFQGVFLKKVEIIFVFFVTAFTLSIVKWEVEKVLPKKV